MTKAIFQYHPEIVERFPQVCGGVILVEDLQNGSSSADLAQAYLAEQQAVLARIGDSPLSQIESLAAWRRAFSAFGVAPTKYRSAAEALLRRLTKKGDIPSINTLVDLGNLVSIRYGLPVAAFDTKELQLPITVHFAGGSEPFAPLGPRSEIEYPQPGEVIFSDETGTVAARRWCWRQSAGSAAGQTTTAAVITVEAQHTNGRADIEAALADLQALIDSYCGGRQQAAMLHAKQLVFAV
jgi:DNA/RNA-binding domain of Phe-tRNA-synthetase-like protein